MLTLCLSEEKLQKFRCRLVMIRFTALIFDYGSICCNENSQLILMQFTLKPRAVSGVVGNLVPITVRVLSSFYLGDVLLVLFSVRSVMRSRLVLTPRVV